METQYQIANKLNADRALARMNNQPFHETKEDRLCATARLAVCIPTTTLLNGGSWDVVIFDEARMSAELMAADIQTYNQRNVAESISGIISRCKIAIFLGADIDVPSMQALLPDCDFNNPQACTIIDNTGGKGGLDGCQIYYTKDLSISMRVLIQLLKRDGLLFLPTNQKKFTLFLAGYLVENSVLKSDQSMLSSSGASLGCRDFSSY
jgi:hypothetical protein